MAFFSAAPLSSATFGAVGLPFFTASTATPEPGSMDWQRLTSLKSMDSICASRAFLSAAESFFQYRRICSCPFFFSSVVACSYVIVFPSF